MNEKNGIQGNEPQAKNTKKTHKTRIYSVTVQCKAERRIILLHPLVVAVC